MVRILEDVYEIEKLKACYADAVDGGWSGAVAHDADAVIALFTADGIWDSGAFGGGEGHRGIREFLATGQAIMPFAFHHITSPKIEVDGDEARGHWHAILAVTIDTGAKLHVGTYNDQFVRTQDGWKFKSLSFTLSASTNLPEPWEIF
jgi:hypothetical protein